MNDPSISYSLAKIRNRYLLKLDAQTRELVNLRAMVEERVSPPPEVLTAIGYLAHKLAGTSATLGFRDLGKTASILDELILCDAERQDMRRELLKVIDELLMQMIAAQGAR